MHFLLVLPLHARTKYRHYLRRIDKSVQHDSGNTDCRRSTDRVSQSVGVGAYRVSWSGLPNSLLRVSDNHSTTRSLASTVYQLFLGSDDSSSTFASLKRTHGMMPYFVMRSILRISNPIAMLRGILELFLARPFGSTSLLQKMFSSGLYEEARQLKEEADLVSKKIGNERMVEKLHHYVNAPREIQAIYQADARSFASLSSHVRFLLTDDVIACRS